MDNINPKNLSTLLIILSGMIGVLCGAIALVVWLITLIRF